MFQLLTYRRNTGIQYFFTVPKDVLNDIIKTIGPSDSRNTRHETTRHDTEDEQKIIPDDSPIFPDAPKISFEREPQYVSPDNQRGQFQALEGHGQTYPSNGGTRALDSGSRGPVDPVNSYGGNGRGSYDTQAAIDRFRQSYGAETRENDRNAVNGAGSSSNSVGGDVRQPIYGNSGSVPQRVNTIPDSGYNYYDANKNVFYGGGAGTPGERPRLEVPDTFDEINFHWAISGFTDCTRTCGGGRSWNQCGFCAWHPLVGLLFSHIL